MKWNKLNNLQQLGQLLKESYEKTILIFKHSTRCSISRAALDRLERNWNDGDLHNVDPWFLDLISYRDVSNAIEDSLNVEHESPQLILIANGKAIYHRSHFAIDYQDLKQQIKN